MTTTFETNTSIGPGGLLKLTQLPFPEGWLVHVKVDLKAAASAERRGFAFGLHAGLVDVPADFNEPLPDSFWLGEDDTPQN
jgi:hypothetical protein